MRKRKLVATALLAVGMSAMLCSCSSDKTVVGAWQDVDSEFGITFYADGTYRDSVYNLPLQYTSGGDSVNYYTAAGDLISVSPKWTLQGRLRIYIGDDYREMKRVDNVADSFDWEFSGDFKRRKATESYSLKGSLPVASELYLGEDNEFWYYLADEATTAAETRGLFAKSNDTRDLVLYYNNGLSADILRASPYGMYIGALPLDSDGELFVDMDYSNLALGVEKGYVLDGVVSLLHSGVDYTFTTDGRCRKSLPSGESLTYNYSISTEGLVALMPVDGVIGTDYMYYDVDQNVIYRLVYQQDSWYDYVSQLAYSDTSTEKQAKGWTVPASLASPSDRVSTLSASYVVESVPQYMALPTLEVSYTQDSIARLRDFLTQVQSSEELRKEFLQAQEDEEERVRKQMQSDERERERVQAIMDARVEAEIAGSTAFGSAVDSSSYNQPADDLSWLDAYLASVEKQPSYDQDEKSSSPVVNTDATLASGTPDPATSTEPPNTEVESTDAEVSQYDPVFHVDFVCTCVNCHVQALPVELDTNNVLLVDESVIAPGTYLSLEGYGMVVARASGGYTSGQTAVCFSNIHNAVNRFSSGTYNVYQVVG